MNGCDIVLSFINNAGFDSKEAALPVLNSIARKAIPASNHPFFSEIAARKAISAANHHFFSQIAARKAIPAANHPFFSEIAAGMTIFAANHR